MDIKLGKTIIRVEHENRVPQAIIRLLVVLGIALWFYLAFQLACGNHVVSERIIRPTQPVSRSIPYPSNWNR